MSKIIAVEWRNSTVGIVAVEQPEGKWRAYIAAIKGYGEEADARHVADFGSCMEEEEARVFFPQFAERAYNAKSGA